MGFRCDVAVRSKEIVKGYLEKAFDIIGPISKVVRITGQAPVQSVFARNLNSNARKREIKAAAPPRAEQREVNQECKSN